MVNRTRRVQQPPLRHCRIIRGIYLYQRSIPAHLQEVAAKINEHPAPKPAWFIRSTGTGNPKEAEIVRDEQIAPDYRKLIKRAEAYSTPRPSPVT